MRLIITVINCLIFALCAFSAPAPEVNDSSGNSTYEALFNKTVKGSVRFSPMKIGQVKVDVNLHGLPNAGGPFIYHIHEKPVPSDGNCYGTLEHLNPYQGSPKALDAADKEVGDLSGKHGNITGRSLRASYTDPYISLNRTDPAFLGNLSIVVHYANQSRIACANITAKR